MDWAFDVISKFKLTTLRSLEIKLNFRNKTRLPKRGTVQYYSKPADQRYYYIGSLQQTKQNLSFYSYCERHL